MAHFHIKIYMNYNNLVELTNALIFPISTGIIFVSNQLWENLNDSTKHRPPILEI